MHGRLRHGAANERAGSKIRSGFRIRQNVIREWMRVRHSLYVDNGHCSEQTAWTEIRKRMAIGSGMPRADFNGATVCEFDMQDEVIGHGISLRLANRNCHNSALMHAVHQVACNKGRNGLFARRCGNEGIRRTALTRCTSRRTRTIGRRHLTADRNSNGPRHGAADFTDLAAIAATTCCGRAAQRAIAWGRGANTIVAIWFVCWTLVPTHAAIVEVIVEIDACRITTIEIADSTPSTTGTAGTACSGHAARSHGSTIAGHAAAASGTAGATCSHGTAIAGHAGGRRSRRPARSSAFDLASATDKRQTHQAEKGDSV